MKTDNDLKWLFAIILMLLCINQAIVRSKLDRINESMIELKYQKDNLKLKLDVLNKKLDAIESDINPSIN